MKKLEVMWHLGVVLVELGQKNLVLLIRKTRESSERPKLITAHQMYQRDIQRQLLSMM